MISVNFEDSFVYHIDYLKNFSNKIKQSFPKKFFNNNSFILNKTINKKYINMIFITNNIYILENIWKNIPYYEIAIYSIKSYYNIINSTNFIFFKNIIQNYNITLKCLFYLKPKITKNSKSFEILYQEMLLTKICNYLILKNTSIYYKTIINYSKSLQLMIRKNKNIKYKFLKTSDYNYLFKNLEISTTLNKINCKQNNKMPIFGFKIVQNITNL